MMGDEEFDAFFAVSYSRLVGQLYAMTGDWAGAQELVLEAYVRAWDHRSQFDLEAAPDSWIRTVAWRLAISRPRNGQSVEPIAYVEALRGVDEDQRRIAVLHDLCDLGIEDIAAEVGMSVEAVRAGLARSQRHQDLIDDLYDHVNHHAHPRLSAQQVRKLGERRRVSRRSATVGGISALALAGVIIAALLAGKPAPPTIAPSASHPTAAHSTAAKDSAS